MTVGNSLECADQIGRHLCAKLGHHIIDVKCVIDPATRSDSLRGCQ